MKLCVFGSASDLIDRKFTEEGEKLGKLMAERGHEMVFGGGALGMMGAAARGISENGGKLTGVVPLFFTNENVETLWIGKEELVFTDGMSERKNKMLELSDGFIITPGGVGTMDEFFEVLTLIHLHRLRKPAAIFNIDHYYDCLVDFLREMDEKHFSHISSEASFGCFTDAEELLDFFESFEENKEK